jgi:hypothetical protein
VVKTTLQFVCLIALLAVAFPLHLVAEGVQVHPRILAARAHRHAALKMPVGRAGRRHASLRIATRPRPHSGRARYHAAPIRVVPRRDLSRGIPRARVVAPVNEAETAAAVAADDPADALAAPPRETTLRGQLAELLLAPMRGSHESLVRQNVRTEQDGLERILDEEDIERQVAAHKLVAIPRAPGLTVDRRLTTNRRYTRPWTAKFLRDVAAAHWQRFASELQVNSAVRTVEFQKRLVHVNGNAAPADGDNASPHLMGATVDLAKKGMTAAEVQWMRGFLTPLEDAGKLDVEEEFHQACFHITVYKSYAPPAKEKLVAANARLRMAPTVPPADN